MKLRPDERTKKETNKHGASKTRHNSLVCLIIFIEDAPLKQYDFHGGLNKKSKKEMTNFEIVNEYIT